MFPRISIYFIPPYVRNRLKTTIPIPLSPLSPLECGSLFFIFILGIRAFPSPSISWQSDRIPCARTTIFYTVPTKILRSELQKERFI